jgi:amidohydrolase
VDASLPVGNIAVEEGPASGGVDTFYGRIIGRGGHGARPNEVVDPIYISAYVILALNGIVSRRLHPFDPAVVSVGTLHAGNTDNVIPDRVETSGTMRYMDLKVREEIQAEIERAFEVARTLGGDYELRFETGYPPMINDPEVVEVIREAAAGMLGEKHVGVPEKGLGAEDFSFLSQLAPGAMFRLGCRIDGDERQHHNQRFDVDEGCLAIGAAILAQAARYYVSGGLEWYADDRG